MGKALAEIERKLGLRMDNNGYQEVIVISTFRFCVKTKEVKR